MMKRGDRREPVFKDEQDRVKFMEWLGETCAKTDWQVYAFCVMHRQFYW